MYCSYFLYPYKLLNTKILEIHILTMPNKKGFHTMISEEENIHSLIDDKIHNMIDPKIILIENTLSNIEKCLHFACESIHAPLINFEEYPHLKKAKEYRIEISKNIKKLKKELGLSIDDSLEARTKSSS